MKGEHAVFNTSRQCRRGTRTSPLLCYVSVLQIDRYERVIRFVVKVVLPDDTSV